MKKRIFVIAVTSLLAGCSWFDHSGQGYRSGGSYDLGRGTTGVSTGADAGALPGITGSEAVPRWQKPPL